MAITGKFIADFTQFDSAVQGSGAKLVAFEGNAAKAVTSIQGMETSAGTATSALGSMGVQLAAMFTVGAVVAFGRSVLDAADQIKKMADQTGLSYAEVQKLNYVAGQSGTSIQSLVGAVQNLQQRLGDDDKGAAAAMHKLNINMEAFNRLNTYDQMLTLAEGIRAVHDPTEQASLAAAIFGKTWKEILPAIKDGMKDTGEAATVMADKTVESLDRVGDAQKRAQQQATAWAGDLILKIEEIGFAWGDYFSHFENLVSHMGQSNSQLLEQETFLAQIEGRVVSGKPPMLALTEAAKGMGMSFEDAAAMAKQMDAEIKTSIDVNTQAAKAVEDQTAAMTRQYPALDKLRGGYETLDHKLAAMEAKLNAASESNDVFDSGLKFTAETIETQVGPAIEKMSEQVHLLSGEMVSLARAQELHAAGGSFAMTAITLSEMSDDFFKKRFGASKSGILALLKQGFSMENAFAIYRSGFNPADWVGDRGPRVPGFAGGVHNFGGGLALVGERGPELVNLPGGSSVFPHGTGGGAVTNHFYLVDNTENLARKVADAIQRSIMSGRKVGSA